MSEDKAEYTWTVSAKQSLTSGMVAFDVTYKTDKVDTTDGTMLMTVFKNAEKAFEGDGYKVAKIIPNNMKELANQKEEKQRLKELAKENQEKVESK